MTADREWDRRKECPRRATAREVPIRMPVSVRRDDVRSADMSCHLEDGSIGPSTIDIVPSSCVPHNMSHGITTGLCGLGRTA